MNPEELLKRIATRDVIGVGGHQVVGRWQINPEALATFLAEHLETCELHPRETILAKFYENFTEGVFHFLGSPLPRELSNGRALRFIKEQRPFFEALKRKTSQPDHSENDE
jgi:hypothetical protein